MSFDAFLSIKCWTKMVQIRSYTIYSEALRHHQMVKAQSCITTLKNNIDKVDTITLALWQEKNWSLQLEPWQNGRYISV